MVASASRWWCCSRASRWSRRCWRCWSACGSRASAPTSSRADSRFTFGRMELLGGIDFMVVAIGVFAIGEVLASMEAGKPAEMLPVPKGLRNLLPTWEDLKACRFAFVNGSLVGFLIGVLPGAGSTIASFITYGIEKAVSKHPEEFGTGVPRAWRPPRARTTPRPAARSSRCSRSASRAAARRRSCSRRWSLWGFKPGRSSSRTTRRSSGDSSPACTSAT